MTCLIEARRVLWLRCELVEAGRWRRGKQRRGGRATEGRSRLNQWAEGGGKDVRLTRNGDTNMPKPEVALTGVSRSRWKLAVGEVSACLHCSNYLPNFHSLYFSNYSQICTVTQKSPKIKVVPNSKFYNFALITIPKFYLDLKMQVWNQKGTL